MNYPETNEPNVNINRNPVPTDWRDSYERTSITDVNGKRFDVSVNNRKLSPSEMNTERLESLLAFPSDPSDICLQSTAYLLAGTSYGRGFEGLREFGYQGFVVGIIPLIAVGLLTWLAWENKVNRKAVVWRLVFAGIGVTL
jgi:hypothetical protein